MSTEPSTVSRWQMTSEGSQMTRGLTNDVRGFTNDVSGLTNDVRGLTSDGASDNFPVTWEPFI